MPRVFVDSSVLIAALLSDSGGSAVILRQGRDKKITIIISENVVGEVIEKLEKINKSKEELTSFILQHNFFVRQKVSKRESEKYLDLVSDPKDAHVLAGAKLSGCGYLVTLDKKHLLNLVIKKRFKPLKIMSPKGMLEEIIR